jgi:tetratricopeptide (TPR) repeat protein
LLSVAATIGREFDVVTLQAACDLDADRALDQLDAASRAGMIEEMPGRLGRYRFRHALLRDAQYAELGPAERATRHLWVARALEAQQAAGIDAPLDELAFHFHAAAPLGEADKAIAYSVAAAERALSQLAYEEAVKHFERARDAFALKPADPVQQVRLLLGLGEAVWQSGDHVRARSLYERAARGARSLGDPYLFGFAALGFDRSTPEDGALHPDAIALLEEALEGLPKKGSRLRAFLLSRLTFALYFAQDRARLEALSQEAIATARGTGQPRAIVSALIARQFVLQGPHGTPAERLAVMDEALKLARTSNDADLAQPAHAWRVIALLEMGDASARTELSRYCQRWEDSRVQVATWHARVLASTAALLDGRFFDARRIATEALVGRQLGLTSVPSQFYVLQTFDILRETGFAEMAEEPLRMVADGFPAVPGWRFLLAILLADLGRDEEAREAIRPIAVNGFADLPRDVNFIPSLAWVAETVVALRELGWAQSIYDLLAPFADRNVVVLYGSVCRGSVSRELGILAAALGRLDDAVAHLEEALAMNVRIGARAFAARTRLGLARVLAQRDAPGDAERGLELAAQAGRAAAELEMPRLAAAVAELESLHGVEPGAAAAAPEAAAQAANGEAPAGPVAAVLRRDGESWTVGYRDEAFRIANMKGLGYLSRLLAEPGREVAALDLVAGGAGNDPPAAGAASESAGERARVNATRAIASAVKRIAQLSPALGRHLSASVRTGLVCAYRPDPNRPISWRL